MVTSWLEAYDKVIGIAWDVEQVVNKEKRTQASAPVKTIHQVLVGTTSKYFGKCPVASSQNRSFVDIVRG